MSFPTLVGKPFNGISIKFNALFLVRLMFAFSAFIFFIFFGFRLPVLADRPVCALADRNFGFRIFFERGMVEKRVEISRLIKLQINTTLKIRKRKERWIISKFLKSKSGPSNGPLFHLLK